MRWCGTRARSAAEGFAVPISMPRYTWAESSETISTATRSARARARLDLPLAVGPSRTYAVPLTATGDVDDRPGEVRRLVGSEPEDGARDLLGLAGALQGRGLADAVHARRVAADRMDVGADDAGTHCVDADALRADLLGEADGERVDRALRGGVVDVLARRAELCRDRGHIDDRAARP